MESGAVWCARSTPRHRARQDVTGRGRCELFATFERIARQMAPPSSTTSADVEKQHPPVTVFEAFIKGLLAETPATAISYLRAALAGQPSFDRARLALWDVYAEQGEHALALAAVVSVPDDSPWFKRARFLAGLSQLNLKKYDDARDLQCVVRRRRLPALLNNPASSSCEVRRRCPGGSRSIFQQGGRRRS